MKTRVRLFYIFLSAIFVVALARSASADDPAAPNAAGKFDVITNSIGMKLSLIPAGEFQMGSAGSRGCNCSGGNSELQSHQVRITKPFYLGVYEVTQAEFVTVLGERNNKPAFHAGNGGGTDFPRENVLWTEAAEFCKNLSSRKEEQQAGRKYRLPTEAEWEYACRAGTTTAFHTGESLSSRQANINGSEPFVGAEPGPYLRKTAKVGSYAPNAFGLYDMHGNVAEWCADWYDPNYYRDSPDADPLGPPVGALSDDYGKFYVTVRGGSWLDDARGCRAAYRQKAMHENRYWWIGFRVVCEVKPGP